LRTRDTYLYQFFSAKGEPLKPKSGNIECENYYKKSLYDWQRSNIKVDINGEFYFPIDLNLIENLTYYNYDKSLLYFWFSFVSEIYDGAESMCSQGEVRNQTNTQKMDCLAKFRFLSKISLSDQNFDFATFSTIFSQTTPFLGCFFFSTVKRG